MSLQAVPYRQEFWPRYPSLATENDEPQQAEPHSLGLTLRGSYCVNDGTLTPCRHGMKGVALAKNIYKNIPAKQKKKKEKNRAAHDISIEMNVISESKYSHVAENIFLGSGSCHMQKR